VGRQEGEKDEQRGEHRERHERSRRGFAAHALRVKEPCLVDIGDGGAHKENGDIEPIGRRADDAVVEIKEQGNEKKPRQDAAPLDAPEVLAVAEKEALHGGKEQHRPKEQLHVLPRRFVHARKRCDPNGLPQPIVYKMQKRAAKGRQRKANQTPKPNRSFHISPPCRFTVLYATAVANIPRPTAVARCVEGKFCRRA